MQTLLDRRLLVVTGKGGTGKTTIAAALGLAAARRGLRTIVLDLTGASTRLAEIFAGEPREHEPASAAQQPESAAPPSADARMGTGFRPTQLAENLFCASIDPDEALLEWMQSLAGRAPARLLASRTSFQYFAAAAPGAKELVCIVKVCALADPDAGDGYDLVVLDAPATGHALALLSAPATFASIARSGPIAAQALRVQETLQDSTLTGYLAVAQASEMAVSETLDLQQELSEQLHVELAAVVVNATLHRRFTGEELERIASLRGEEQTAASSRLATAAAAAAHAAHARTRFQHGQIARLRRHGLNVLQVPFVFQSDLDLGALRRIAERLDRDL